MSIEHANKGGKRIIRNRQVRDKVGWSNTTLYAKIREGIFPAPIKLGANSVGWLEHEVEAFIDERIAESRNQKAEA